MRRSGGAGGGAGPREGAGGEGGVLSGRRSGAGRAAGGPVPLRCRELAALRGGATARRRGLPPSHGPAARPSWAEPPGSRPGSLAGPRRTVSGRGRGWRRRTEGSVPRARASGGSARGGLLGSRQERGRSRGRSPAYAEDKVGSRRQWVLGGPGAPFPAPPGPAPPAWSSGGRWGRGLRAAAASRRHKGCCQRRLPADLAAPMGYCS